MNSPRLRYEGWLYGLAFLMAIGFRLIALGATPLRDSEATLAMQALNVARGTSPLLGPQPAYILLTSIFFTVIKSTNFMARFLPALVGSALVFAPVFFRQQLKPRPAVILAFLIAMDPGLVALSRLASGTILAVTFSIFAVGLWTHRRLIPAGILAGLALLSGPSLWAGLLNISLTWLFMRGLGSRSKTDSSPASNSPISLASITDYQIRPALIALLLTLVLAGTLFFTAPNGLSAWLDSIPAYFKGWVAGSTMTPARMLFTLLVYEPLGIFLAIFSLIRGYRTGSARIIQLSIWLAVSLLLATFYRQPGELAWAILPLLALAALELSRSLNIFPSERLEVGIVTTALLILLTYIWFDIAAIGLDPFNQFVTSIPLLGSVQNPRYAILYGAIAILIACIAFVAFGWSGRTAWLGSTWAFIIFFTLYTFGAAWGASGLRSKNGVELWTLDQKPAEANLLLATVDNISDFSLGHEESQPVTIMGIDSPALEWLLRNHAVKLVSALGPQSTPPIIITPPIDNLNLPSAYRGQG
ncbi:MAG TPA: hypothetical protein VK909_09090, partial [Anaerolineales bacterium]|nr:hypothetical protein [Anaerolineales bacterium]